MDAEERIVAASLAQFLADGDDEIPLSPFRTMTAHRSRANRAAIILRMEDGEEYVIDFVARRKGVAP